MSAVPLYVDLSQDADVKARAQRDCRDVLFTAADGVTKLAHRWKATCGGAWINSAALTLPASGDPVIYVYMGNAAASDQSNAPGVWDSNYGHVWEFQNGALTDDVGTSTCVVHGTSRTDASQIFTGTTAVYLDGATYLQCPATVNSTFSIEIWFRPGNWSAYGPPDGPAPNGNIYAVGSGSAGLGTGFSWAGYFGSGPWTSASNNLTPIAPAYGRNPFYYLYVKGDVYQHIMVSDNGSTQTVSWNGTNVGTLPSRSLNSNGNIYIGAGFAGNAPDCSASTCWQGWVDEVRISNTNRASSFAGTEYENIRYPQLFYSIGALEQNTSAKPTINTFSSEANIISGDTVALHWFVSGASSVSIDHGAGSQTALVSGSANVSPTATTTYTLTATNNAGTTTQTYTITPLTANGGMYLHAGYPSLNAFCGYTSSPLTLYVCGGQEPGYKVGDVISVWGLCSTDSSHYYLPNFGPRLRISAMTDAGTIQVVNHDGTPINPNGTFGACASVPEYGGTVTMFAGPAATYAGGFDGLNGPHMRQLGISTDNGLDPSSGVVCNGSTCTIRTTYQHGLNTGDKVTVWGTTDTCTSGGLRSCLGTMTGGSSPTLNDHAITVVDTQTYTFPSSASGNFTMNNACSPYPNCVVVSSQALSNYGPLTQMISILINQPRSGGGAVAWGDTVNGGPGYRCTLDGGVTPCGQSGTGQGDSWLHLMHQGPAILNFIDRGNGPVHDGLVYVLTHIERQNGNAWTMPENQLAQGYQNALLYYLDAAGWGPLIYDAVAGKVILSSGDQTTMRDKLYADIENYQGLTPCNKSRSVLHPTDTEAPAFGMAACGTCDATHVTLDSGTGSTDWTNYAVWLYDHDTFNYFNERLGFISSYNTTTRVATVTFPGPPYGGAWSTAPNSQTHYRILPTAICTGGCVSPGVSGTGGTVMTITGTGTHWSGLSTGSSSPFLAADALYTPGGFPLYFYFSGALSAFQSITDDTHATVIINDSTMINNSYRVPVLWSLGYRSGDCGLRWACEHFGFSGHSNSYIPSASMDIFHGFPEMFHFNNNDPIHVTTEMTADFGFSADDIRATIAGEQSHMISLWFSEAFLAVGAGVYGDGNGYNLQDQNDALNHVLAVTNSFGSSYPNLDTSGAWITNSLYYKIYNSWPSNPYGNRCFATLGTSTGYCGNDNTHQGSFAADGYLHFNPGTTLAQEYSTYVATYIWTKNLGQYDGNPYLLASVDSRISTTAMPYTNLPLQRFLGTPDSKTACQNATGWHCWPNLKSNAIYSYGSQQSGGARWTDTSATFVGLIAPGFPQITYGTTSGSSLTIYNTGTLVGCDQANEGASLGNSQWGSNGDNSKYCDTLPLTGFYTNENPDYGYSQITRWACAGNPDCNGGDPNSKYFYAMADDRGAYLGMRPNRALREVVHFKKPGFEEIVLDHKDYDIANMPAQPVTDQFFLQENTQSANWGNDYRPFNEGPLPKCPSTNAQCASLTFSSNVSGAVISTQSGAAADSIGPARNKTLIARIISPADTPLNLRYDGSSTNGTYTWSGSHGYAEKVSICSGTCGANATAYESIKVYKITTQPDTLLTVSSPNAGTNWLTAQTADKVAAFSRAGALQTSLAMTTSFTAPTAQHLIAGLAPGSYNVTVNGAAVVTGAAVSAGDNSLYFEAGAGGLSIVPNGSAPVLTISCAPGAGSIGVSYSATCTAFGGTAPYTWSVASGTLPPGVSFSAAGMFSGVPTSAGDFAVTVRVTDAASGSATAGVTIHIAGPATTLSVGVLGVTAGAALLRYGVAGLDARTSCTVSVSGTPFVDAGGAALRAYVAASLAAGTSYTAQVTCGGAQGTASFRTDPARTPVTLKVPVAVLPRTGVASVRVDYGSTAGLGSSVSAACAGGCVVNVPATSGTVVWVRETYLDGLSRVVAQGAARAMVVK